MDGPPDPVGILRAPALAHHDGRAGAEAQKQVEEQPRQVGGGVDGPQGVLAHALSHDDGVGDAEDLLKDALEKDGDEKQDHFFPDHALGDAIFDSVFHDTSPGGLLRVFGFASGAAEQRHGGGDGHENVGRPAHKVEYGEAENAVHEHVDEKHQLQTALVVPEAEDGDGVFQIGDHGQPAQQPPVVERHTQHHAQGDQRPLHGPAPAVLNGRQVAQDGHHVLGGAAVTLQYDGADAVKDLAQHLDGQDLTALFPGAADGIGDHRPQAAHVADKDIVQENTPQIVIAGQSVGYGSKFAPP